MWLLVSLSLWLVSVVADPTSAPLYRMFRGLLDTNHDGHASLEELVHYFGSLVD